MNRTDRAAGPGINRTGIYLSSSDGPAVVEGAREAALPPGSARDLAAARRQFTVEGQPIGHVPPPASLRRPVRVGPVLRRRVDILLDRLGERLVLERTAVRLYDALLAKHEAHGSWRAGPAHDDLARFRADEAHHFALLQDVLVGFGADPTAVTPSADLVGVALAGVVQVVSDPRTTLAQALQAHLVAELVDVAAWEQLVALAADLGDDALALKLQDPLARELRHRDAVTTWLKRHAELVLAGELRYEV